MKHSNLPPGVSVEDIPGCSFEDAAWEKLFDTMREQSEKHRMSDMDAFVAWRLGVMAWESAKKMGAKFPHD